MKTQNNSAIAEQIKRIDFLREVLEEIELVGVSTSNIENNAINKGMLEFANDLSENVKKVATEVAHKWQEKERNIFNQIQQGV